MTSCRACRRVPCRAPLPEQGRSCQRKMKHNFCASPGFWASLAGFYCGEAAGGLVPTPCTYGEYCPEQSIAPRPCPPGYYCANEALEWPTGRCRGGYICNQRATTHSPEVETAGDNCPELSEGYPCPAGFYCQSSGCLLLPRRSTTIEGLPYC